MSADVAALIAEARKVHGMRQSTLFIDRLADALESATRKDSLTVRTVEELDALPVGSVVMGPQGRSWQRFADNGSPFYHQWMCGDGGFVRHGDPPRMLIPATVLYSPEAS